MFEALILRREGDRVVPSVEQLSVSDLPGEGDTLVDVEYSSLNYKDALAVSDRGRVILGDFPFVPGIDSAGIVIETDSKLLQPGDPVISTGGGAGERFWGGYSGVQRVDSQWLVRRPENISAHASMILGTAGLTAMLSVRALESAQVRPEDGPVVVTGATGGVGSIAVILLSEAGYHVVASTGKADAVSYLEKLGATEVIDRSEFSSGAGKALDSARWAGAIDSVGGPTLEALISQTGRSGGIAVCGLAGGHELHSTVFPFILRGVSLHGIDSNACPPDTREHAWKRLADAVQENLLEEISTTIPLSDIPERADEMLSGRMRGRTVVELGTSVAGKFLVA